MKNKEIQEFLRKQIEQRGNRTLMTDLISETNNNNTSHLSFGHGSNGFKRPSILEGMTLEEVRLNKALLMEINKKKREDNRNKSMSSYRL